MTWKRGREIVFSRLEKDALPLDLFIKSIGMGDETKYVPGEAIFLTSTPNIVPHAMLHNIKHNKVLHERNVLVTVITQDIPYVGDEERLFIEKLDDRFYRIFVYYGFKDQPNIPKALEQAYASLDFEFDMMRMSFFISRDRLIHTVGDGMSPWRENCLFQCIEIPVLSVITIKYQPIVLLNWVVRLKFRFQATKKARILILAFFI